MTDQKRPRRHRSWRALLLLIVAVLISWYLDVLNTGPDQPRTIPEKPDLGSISRDLAYGGLPKNISHPCRDIVRLDNEGFIVGYCEELKNPAWAVYRVGKKTSGEIHKRPRRFQTDKRTQSRVDHGDYTNTGYDRGHMAPNHAIESRFGRQAQLQTFLMSNICPQKPDLNRKVWRELEETIADDYANRLGEVWVITGPIFSRQPPRLESGVAIPEAFFKVVIDERPEGVRTQAYIVPQDVSGDEPPEQFLTSIDEVERRSGLDLLWEFDDAFEDKLEGISGHRDW